MDFKVFGNSVESNERKIFGLILGISMTVTPSGPLSTIVNYVLLSSIFIISTGDIYDSFLNTHIFHELMAFDNLQQMNESGHPALFSEYLKQFINDVNSNGIIEKLTVFPIHFNDLKSPKSQFFSTQGHMTELRILTIESEN